MTEYIFGNGSKVEMSDNPVYEAEDIEIESNSNRRFGAPMFTTDLPQSDEAEVITEILEERTWSSNEVSGIVKCLGDVVFEKEVLKEMSLYLLERDVKLPELEFISFVVEEGLDSATRNTITVVDYGEIIEVVRGNERKVLDQFVDVLKEQVFPIHNDRPQPQDDIVDAMQYSHPTVGFDISNQSVNTSEISNHE